MNTKKVDIILSAEPLSVQACYDAVRLPECGGIDIFVGTVRNQTRDKAVLALEFEAYEPMAISEMQKIAQVMQERFGVYQISMHHRTGQLAIGDIAVVIAVSAPHRAAAFDACRYAIDTLKQTVPIWKKEIFTDGEVWVAAHP